MWSRVHKRCVSRKEKRTRGKKQWRNVCWCAVPPLSPFLTGSAQYDVRRTLCAQDIRPPARLDLHHQNRTHVGSCCTNIGPFARLSRSTFLAALPPTQPYLRPRHQNGKTTTSGVSRWAERLVKSRRREKGGSSLVIGGGLRSAQRTSRAFYCKILCILWLGRGCTPRRPAIRCFQLYRFHQSPA